MDKAALFSAILKRNALRRQANLPLLDVRAELARAVSDARSAEYRTFCESKQADLDRITAEVFAETGSGSGMGHAMRVRSLANERFETFIFTTYGVARPTDEHDEHHEIIYGQDKDKA